MNLEEKKVLLSRWNIIKEWKDKLCLSYHSKDITIEYNGDEIKDALCYYDHCFGRIPSESAWHWIAVQNEEVSLASLVNYGPYAQRYTLIKEDL